MTRLSTALADRERILRELGTGGMATVHLAEDLKDDCNVALRVLRPELAVGFGADRFVVEINTTAALQQPHRQPLFDLGAADGFHGSPRLGTTGGWETVCDSVCEAPRTDVSWRVLTSTLHQMPEAVTDAGSGESWFEPRRGN